MIDKNSLWCKVQDRLKNKVSPAAFKTWFAQIELRDAKEREGDLLVEILAPNTFSQEQLSGRYAPLLESVLEETTGKRGVFRIGIKQKELKVREAPLFEINGELKKGGVPALSPQMSFASFLVGASNKLAHAATQAICLSPGETYNPLFIYGPTAVGKTHLLHAIGNELLKIPGFRLVYRPCEGFTNEFIQAISERKTAAFRERYRQVDALLLDDVQFLSGRQGLQGEFFHTFNELHGRKKQVVLTCDKHPAEMGGVEERLVSRFLGGLNCAITLPDQELKTAILLGKAQGVGISISRELATKLVQGLKNSREIEGVVAKISSFELVGGEPGGEEDMVRELVKEARGVNRPSPRKIVTAISRFYNLKTVEVLGTGKKRSLSIPRQIAMYLLRKELGLPFSAIGEFLGRKDHTTVIHGVKQVERLLLKNEQLKAEVEQIKSLLF